MKHIISLTFFIILFTLTMEAQNIAINEIGTQPDTSAILDISSTTKGLLIPRMNKARKNAIPLPATGLMVYQTAPDSVGFHYYDGTKWNLLAAGSNSEGWLTTGNAATDTAIHFLGTTDNTPLRLRQNNLWMGQLNSKNHTFFIGGGAGVNNTATQNTGFGDSTLHRNTSGIGNTAIGYRSMVGSGPITGGINTAIGNNTLSAITSGYQNIAIGDNALNGMKTGAANVVAGAGAMEGASKGDANIAIGLWALRTNDSASYNIAIGQQALYSNDSSRNIGIGHQALYYNNRGNNMAVGYQSGYYNSRMQSGTEQGIENTYLGFQTGYYANTGSKNVAIGSRAMYGGGWFNSDNPNNDNYKRNVAVGDSSLFSTVGSDNVGVGFKSLSKSASGNGHVAIGSRALQATTATYPNTAVGYSSQDSCTTGLANTTLGSYSLTKNTAGYNNTAIGNFAMHDATNTINPAWMFDNTAIGNDALRLVRYSGETAVGAGALRNDTGSKYNTAVGFLSMFNHLSGGLNTALGTSALRNDLTGNQNTALGVNTLYYHKTGSNNIAIGYSALFYDTASSSNLAMGNWAMYSHLKNDNNTAVGQESMYFDINGYQNTALGWRSLRYAKNPGENTAIGVGALELTDSALYNTAVGRGAMMGKGGRANTAVGYLSSGLQSGPSTGYYVNETTTIGYQAGFRNIADLNTFVGSNAGYGGADSLKGIENTGIGAYALFSNTTGKSNTVVGIGSLYGNITGQGNTALGTRALGYSTTNYNVAVGDSAMFTNNGNANLAVGTFSMRWNNTGEHNAATGNFSLINNLTGSRNVAFGDSTLFVNNSGSNNTAIGYMATTAASNLINATAIGSNAMVSQNNSLVLGSINGVNNATADTKVGVGTTTPDSTFSVANKFSVGNSGTVQFDNGVPVMNYMFKSGLTNANRMVVAHSPLLSNYGLQYQDAGDKFNFLSNGTSVLTVDLALQRIGIGVASPGYQLQLSTDGAAKFLTSTWSTTSDIRLKTVDGNYTKGLKEIIKLNTIMYHYAAGNARNLSCEGQGIGFSAQEVQKIFPEAVTQEKDGYYSLNIHPILIAYVNAFKEQQQQIDELKTQVGTGSTTSDKDLLQTLLKRIEVLETKLASTK
jgi:trimeric autotransporter adhesin